MATTDEQPQPEFTVGQEVNNHYLDAKGIVTDTYYVGDRWVYVVQYHANGEIFAGSGEAFTATTEDTTRAAQPIDTLAKLQDFRRLLTDHYIAGRLSRADFTVMYSVVNGAIDRHLYRTDRYRYLDSI